MELGIMEPMNNTKYTYMVAHWIGAEDEYPYMQVSELDTERWENRRVEFYCGGKIIKMNKHDIETSGAIEIVQIPTLSEINKSQEFIAHEISETDFNLFWEK